MNDINTMTISGVVVEPPRMASTQSGKRVCKMRIKSTSEKNGRESSVFIDVDVWEAAGADYANTIPQGAGVAVHGRFSMNTWQDQNGNKRSTPVCVASTIIPLMAGQMPPAQQPMAQQYPPSQYCQPQYYQQGAPMQGGGYGVPAQPPQMPPIQMQAPPQTYQQYHQQAVAANAQQPAQNEQPSGKQAQDGEAKDGDLPF